MQFSAHLIRCAALLLMAAVTLSAAQPQAVDQADRCDPNYWPAEFSAREQLLFEAAVEPNAAAAPLPGQYWQPVYHPQVNGLIWRVLGYSRTADGPAGARTQLDYAALAQAAADPNLDPARLLQALQGTCDLIHTWRATNESPATALEVVRALELTRRQTGIYQLLPAEAVQIKRTLGMIAHVNGRFERTSREALSGLLGRRVEPEVLAHLEKDISDLEVLLHALARQNDAMTVALGIGPSQRGPQGSAPIDYTGRALEVARDTPAATH